jgi:hypothetical protein
MSLIITLPVWSGNADLAESLLDYSFQLTSKTQMPLILLAFHPSVHAEMRERLKVSAELAFSEVDVLELRQLADPKSPKTAHTNSALRQVAQYVSESYRWPYLWLEPDCTPIKADWYLLLEKAVRENPRHYLGNRMKAQFKTGDIQFMARVGVYAPKAISEPSSARPIELEMGPRLAPALTRTSLIQHLPVATPQDLEKIKPGVALVHGDKLGLLRKQVEGTLKTQTRVTRRMAREAKKDLSNERANGEVQQS